MSATTMDSGTADLASLKLSALKRRCRGAGADPAAVEDLDEANDPKASAIALIRRLQAAADEATASQNPHDDLRGELAGLTLKALKARARDDGAVDGQLDDVDDADDPKAFVIELIVSLQPASGPSETELRAELEKLKLKALKARAREVGVAAEAVDDFDDADDAKVAAIDAIVSVVCGVSGKPLAVEWKWGSHNTGI